jgi:hypothetical protein
MLIGADEALIFPADTDWDRAQQQLADASFGDGLPLVVPTQARLKAMLAGVADPARSLGAMAPLFGELTLEAIAYCCVLAGCKAAELAVVATAAAATLSEEFNLLGIQTTTGTPTVCVVVHGPAVRELGLNSGTNCLGPGNRANACIGRSVHLVLTHIGGARPEIADMATMGQPGKYIFCFAEGEHPLIPPLSRRRGIDANTSAVTVIGVSGTLEVLPRQPADSAEHVLLAIIDAMHGTRLAYGAGRDRPAGEQFILIPPEMADLVQKHGYDLPAMQEFILKNSPPSLGGAPWPLARSAKDINCILTGGAGVKMTCLAPWGGGTYSVTRPLLAIR